MNALTTTLSHSLGRLAPSATTMIRKDHAAVLAQFHRIDPSTSDAVREAATRSIAELLEIHARVEEELFYPALREAGIRSASLEKAPEEHEQARRLIERLRGSSAMPAERDDALNELMNAVMHHVADEETQLLPAAERFLGPSRLADLGARMTARKLELARPKAGRLVGDLARAAPARTALVTVGLLVAGTWLLGQMRRSGPPARFRVHP